MRHQSGDLQLGEFGVPERVPHSPLTTTLVLTALAALIVLRKNATVKSLDVMVPIMAVCYFVLTVGILVVNFRQLPAVLGRILPRPLVCGR